MQIKTKSATDVVKTYDPYRQQGNRAEYISASHSDLKKDKVIVSSTAGSGKNAAAQNRRSNVNFVRSVEVPAAEVGKSVLKDAKIEVLASLPTGMTDVEFDELCANAAGFFSDIEQVKTVLRIGRIA